MLHARNQQREDQSDLDNLQLSRITLDDWQDYVATHPQSTAFHHRNWLELISAQYGFPTCIYGIVKDGEIGAALPFIETKSALGKRKLSSLPYTDSIRVLASSPEYRVMFGSALRHFKPLDAFTQVVVKTDQPYLGEPIPIGMVRHQLNLTRSLEEVRSGFSSSAIRNIKRANGSGLRFEVSSSVKSLKTFYSMHVETRRRLGVPVQPKSFFDRLYRSMVATDLGKVAMVRLGGEAIAAVLILGYRKTLIYKYSASRTTARHLRPNDFLVANLIEYSIATGYHCLDFGTSRTQESGLRRFKSKWGAEELDVTLDHVCGLVNSPAADSPLLAILSAVIRRSPRLVCRGLGELFYRFGA